VTRRNTDEWKAVLLGGRCDDGERPVATGDAECIRAALDGLTNERRQRPIGADDAHLDPAFARMLRQFRAHGLSAAGRRVDEQHRLSRRNGASPATVHQLLIVSVHVRGLAAVFVGLPPFDRIRTSHGGASRTFSDARALARRASDSSTRAAVAAPAAGVAAAWQRRARRCVRQEDPKRREEQMAEVENVVVARFTEPSKAYQALSVLKECDAEGRIALQSAAIVERTAEGELRIPEGTDNIGLVGTASGSLIGMLIGVLGGPVGVLVGWGAGALIGGAFDVDRAVKSDEALTALGRAIPPESTAVIATVAEPAVEVIDGEMAKLEGEVTRRPVAEVMDELEAAEEAAEAAAREARRTLREERKAELTASLDARVGKLKEKLHVS
jgi:uncharacterized membrane protein